MKSQTDGELLSAFAEKRDDEAFAELVRRHGPLVFNVCRRVMGNQADAEDAAQAAFLALAQEAKRQRTPRSTAGWLHRVARNIALNALESNKARDKREKEVAAMAPRTAQPAGLSDEQGALLHEEIDALPEKYRQAVVLCHLQGKSLEQAATIMACPKATMGTWVLRGRERLRSRLAQRGFVLSLATFTSLLSTEAGAAELPATFVVSTTSAAARFVAGKAGAGAGVPPIRSASLAEGALKEMSHAKMQMVVVMVVLFLSIGAGTGWLVSRATGAEGDATKRAPGTVVAPSPVTSPVVGNKPAVAVSEEDQKALVGGNTAFALKLYRVLAAKEGNLFFSPYSISSALGMTYAGARGNTDTEMKTALCFPLEQAKLHPAFNGLNGALASTAKETGQKLNIANGLCLTGADVNKEFKALLADHYGAELFAGDLDVINGWVKKKTEGKIEQILKELHPQSVCVLLNAIYFKGTWASQFKERSTREAPFRMSSVKSVRVPLMYQKGAFRLLQQKGFQAISIPYKGKQLSMVIFLPRKVDGLPAMEKKLTTDALAQWLTALDKRAEGTTDLYIPKYKVETEYDLVPPCKQLGMKDAFQPNVADFRGMGWPKGKLWINQIKHKAFVEVNEEGTEAAAATAVEMVTEMARMDPVFRADHPFLFIIRDNPTGTILFMGRMADPSGK